MKYHARILIVSLFLIIAFIMVGCDQGVKEDDVKEALDSQNEKEILETISSYQEQKNKDELDEVVVKDFEERSSDVDYDGYIKLESISSKIKDTRLKSKIDKVLEDNIATKVKSFTEGNWIRKDYTDMDGLVQNIKWNGDKGVAIVTNVSKVKDNSYGFRKGDVKFKDIEVLSETELLSESLNKSEDDSGYNEAYTTIDYDNGIMICRISRDKANYEQGGTQVWVKESLVDKKKELLTKKDYIFNKEIKLDNDKDHYFFYNYNASKKRDRTVDMRGEVKLLSTRKEVMKEYGYGHILYQSYKSDPFYIFAKSDKKEYGKYYPGEKEFVKCIKNTSYAVIYNNKKRTRFIKMFFDKKDRFIATVTGYDYDYHVKDADQY